MDTRIAKALYLVSSAAIIGIATYVAILAGLSPQLAVPAAFVCFVVLNGALAIWYSARHARSQKASTPSFLGAVFAPGPHWRGDEAPLFARLMASAIAALVGAFFVFCSVALAIDAEWSRISNPIAAFVVCLTIGGIGVALLFAAWRLAFPRTNAHVA